jgi:hypothetical protein
MARFAETPIFDADQHMYETSESLTKYLPEKYSRAVQFVQIDSRPGSPSTARSPTSSPTFERVAAPGAHEKFFAARTPRG